MYVDSKQLELVSLMCSVVVLFSYKVHCACEFNQTLLGTYYPNYEGGSSITVFKDKVVIPFGGAIGTRDFHCDTITDKGDYVARIRNAYQNVIDVVVCWRLDLVSKNNLRVTHLSWVDIQFIATLPNAFIPKPTGTGTGTPDEINALCQYGILDHTDVPLSRSMLLHRSGVNPDHVPCPLQGIYSYSYAAAGPGNNMSCATCDTCAVVEECTVDAKINFNLSNCGTILGKGELACLDSKRLPSGVTYVFLENLNRGMARISIPRYMCMIYEKTSENGLNVTIHDGLCALQQTANTLGGIGTDVLGIQVEPKGFVFKLDKVGECGQSSTAVVQDTNHTTITPHTEPSTKPSIPFKPPKTTASPTLAATKPAVSSVVKMKQHSVMFLSFGITALLLSCF